MFGVYVFFSCRFQFHDAHVYEGRSEKGCRLKMVLRFVGGKFLSSNSLQNYQDRVNSQYICVRHVLGMFAVVIKKCTDCLIQSWVE